MHRFQGVFHLYKKVSKQKGRSHAWTVLYKTPKRRQNHGSSSIYTTKPPWVHGRGLDSLQMQQETSNSKRLDQGSQLLSICKSRPVALSQPQITAYSLALFAVYSGGSSPWNPPFTQEPLMMMADQQMNLLASCTFQLIFYLFMTYCNCLVDSLFPICCCVAIFQLAKNKNSSQLLLSNIYPRGQVVTWVCPTKGAWPQKFRAVRLYYQNPLLIILYPPLVYICVVN